MILVNLPCHEEGNRYRMLKILCLVMVLLNDVTESGKVFSIFFHSSVSHSQSLQQILIV